MTNEEELQERSGVSDVEPICRTCGKPDGGLLGESTIRWSYDSFCCCMTFEPLDAADILERENENI